MVGNCGASLAPLNTKRIVPPLDLLVEHPDQFEAEVGAYLKRLDDEPAAVSVVALAGHTTLRVGAMDDLNRPASQSETAAMRRALERGLEAGAAGLSTGLFYPPANAAPSDEVLALAEVVREAGGIYTTHMRDEGDRVAESLRETFALGRQARVPAIISHHKCAGLGNHGRSRETLALIDDARRTQAIGLDCYPYIAASTVLDTRRMDAASRIIVTWSKAHLRVCGPGPVGHRRRLVLLHRRGG